MKISTHPECPVNTLVDIVNAITDESKERIDNGRTDLETVKIIGKLPIDRIVPQHIVFIGVCKVFVATLMSRVVASYNKNGYPILINSKKEEDTNV